MLGTKPHPRAGYRDGQTRFSGKRREILDFMDWLLPIVPATMDTRVKYARICRARAYTHVRIVSGRQTIARSIHGLNFVLFFFHKKFHLPVE